eukprot:14111-Heterococcus_DN1.PRE.4
MSAQAALYSISTTTWSVKLYFDGELWMEQFEEKLLTSEQPGASKVSVNVYRRVGDLTEADKTQLKAVPKNAQLQTQRR